MVFGPTLALIIPQDTHHLPPATGVREVIHGDVKPSSILLDEDMTVHLGDFGLAKILTKSTNTTWSNQSFDALKGSIGYTPVFHQSMDREVGKAWRCL
ncbi:hypothetical protein H5410_055410 [Solanum commersonii]|uniref:Protein kinase domain-containing protein n=1 Tax=Solanum commersonii TaxID=4109 RepID=A0A9J5WJ88_SOLCO|nr:hypothetical protein H5410_055410 [Solanum commersonii]